ncbi:REP-associated tyrosine transposase [Pseudoduganella albidiflava]|uniref:Transposase n=1 Tax=Pseudoduganella albidiflava TaxID=321983 RepID=A0A411WT63_9BURK|nr:transposase [Pseudoduganella albidiflava]QBH99984.1 transposase [Pseudoduganella albidiflava]GGY55323.1 hypothetical protein GCM10007387_42320 [Pseudoduganella albidiflava]
MGRPTRHQFAGAIYHITTRGNRRAHIFADDIDKQIWYRILCETASRFQLVVYGVCLMPNHFHLLFETPDANLSSAMQYLNGKYAHKFNWRHGLTGHLFQGRFGDTHVVRQEHLLELLRYIVLNPVRAALVEHPDEWPWSSHVYLSGFHEAPPWLNVDWALDQFSGATMLAKKLAYRVFVDARIPLSKRRYYARPEVIERIHEIPSIPTLEQFARLHLDRSMAVAAAWACGGYSRDQIARYFGISTRTVSRMTRTTAC